MNKTLSPQKMRRTVLKMAHRANCVHIACAFSLIEIVSVLYERFAHISAPEDPKRDIVALSKGHGVMAFYAGFLEMGWLKPEQIENYFADGSDLKGLSDSHIPGIEVSGGSLGHGLTVSVGMALASKLKGESRKIFCIVGDGEMNEGSIWESLLFAAHWKLDNLVVIVDANEWQAMGRCTDVLNGEPLVGKFKAFNFDTWECDGHRPEELSKVFTAALAPKASPKPSAIVARTVKGKGVSFMEDDNQWHYSRLTDESFAKAIKELE